MWNYIEISHEKLQDLFFDWEISHEQSERWQFLCYNPKYKKWVVADNRTHDFFMEEFETKKEAINWLKEY